MDYNANIPNNQGAVKASEVAIDRPQDIIKTIAGDTGIVATEQIIRALGDSLRRINYIMFSDNEITWDGSNIKFGTLTTPSAIKFRLLQTEDFINQYTTSGPGFIPPKTIDLVLQGSNVSDSATTFNTVPLAPNTILYLELDRNTILNSSGSGGVVTIQNAISGGYIVSGSTARTSLMGPSSGLPSLTSVISGPTQTFYIPIAMHHQWTDGVNTYDDLLWIPHGIRWVKNTQSTVGAIITSQGVGLVPPGGIVAVMSNMPGSYSLPTTGTVDSFGWMRADGATIPGGHTVSGPTPNLTGGVFIYGTSGSGVGANLLAGVTGGSNGPYAITLTAANIPTITSSYTPAGSLNITGSVTGVTNGHVHYTMNAGSSSNPGVAVGSGNYAYSVQNFGVSGDYNIRGNNASNQANAGLSSLETDTFSASGTSLGGTLTGTPAVATYTNASPSSISVSTIPKYVAAVYLIRVQ